MSDDEGYVPPKMSTGQDNTLGNWRDLTAAMFGVDSPATAFLDDKIASSPHGRDEYVLADERQLLNVLVQLHLGGGAPDTEVSQ
jgi:hypothetical protein